MQGLRLRLFLILGSLTALAPLATDFYLPGVPALAASFLTSSASAQLTLSTSLAGLALGQLVAGPLSDRYGRRRPLLAGLLLFVVTSVLCAVSPNILVLVVLRLAQGLAGSAGVVIARAVVRDLREGRQAALLFSRLMLVMGLAPVVAPVLGAQLLRVTTWRGLFLALALIGVVLLVACWAGLEETHPAGRRAVGASRPVFAAFGPLLGDAAFRGFVLAAGLQGVTLFSYIAMSPFVVERYGLSPTGFSLMFAANSVGLVIGSQVNAALVLRLPLLRLLGGGLALILVASSAMVVAAVAGAGFVFFAVPLWWVLFGLGTTMANTTALALGPHPRLAGSASALLGSSQFLLGAAVAPLVSLVGATAAVLATTLVCASGLALITVLGIRSPTDPRSQDPRSQDVGPATPAGPDEE